MNGYAPREVLFRLFDWKDSFLHQLFGSDLSPWEALDQLERRLSALEPSERSIESLREQHPHAWFDPEGRYWIDPTARIEPGAFLSGQVFLGPGAVAGHASRLRGPIYLGPNARAGHACEIKHSILLEGAVAAHLNFVGDSILGEGVNLGAGAVCANLRFDQRPIVIKVEDLRIQSAKRKCGAFVGAGAQIGCSATLSPGAVIGREAWVGPNLNIRGWVAAGARIFSAEGVGRGIA